MQAIDFFDTNGEWIDSCEPWQIDSVFAVLVVLYGAVTWQERQGEAQGNAMQEFSDWLLSV